MPSDLKSLDVETFEAMVVQRVDVGKKFFKYDK